MVCFALLRTLSSRTDLQTLLLVPSYASWLTLKMPNISHNSLIIRWKKLPSALVMFMSLKITATNFSGY